MTSHPLTNSAQLPAIDVSIVIGTFNRADVLPRALASLAAQQTGGQFTYEVVVVDNASTDATPSAIAAAECGNAVAIRGLTELKPGVAAVRNCAIRAANGTWIAFHDDDQVADPNWLGELLATASRRKCTLVAGAVDLELPASNDRELDPVCRRLLGAIDGIDDECRFGRRLVPGTNNLMIHRSVLDEVGLFDEGCVDGGEDAELYRRIRTAGHVCWYTPQAIVHHIIAPQRLADEYMRWTAMRQGGHIALRELRDWGRLVFPAVLLGRFAQASCRYFPKYLAARARGQREQAFGARCLMWRSEGYIRSGLTHLLPAVFKQSSFHEAMNFRQGRQKLVNSQ